MSADYRWGLDQKTVDRLECGNLLSIEDVRQYIEAWVASDVVLHGSDDDPKRRKTRIDQKLIPSIMRRMVFGVRVSVHALNMNSQTEASLRLLIENPMQSITPTFILDFVQVKAFLSGA